MTKLAEELRECDEDELETRLINARKELFNLRFQVATGRLDNVARIGQVRKQVACILTVQRDREITAFEALEAGDTEAPVAEPRPPRRARRAAAADEAGAPPAEETAGSVAAPPAAAGVPGGEAISAIDDTVLEGEEADDTAERSAASAGAGAEADEEEK